MHTLRHTQSRQTDMIITLVLQRSAAQQIRAGKVYKIASLLWDLIIVSSKCAKDSVTVFHLQVIYKSQVIEIESSWSVNLCIYIYWTTATQTQTSGVIGSKSLTLLKDLQNCMFGQHTGEVRALPVYGTGHFLYMARKYCFCYGMVGPGGLCIKMLFWYFSNLYPPSPIIIIFVPITFFK